MRTERVTNYMRTFALLVAALSLATAAPAHSQTTAGAVRGTVSDQAGAPVSGATVTARGVDLGMTRTVTTGENGFYNLAGLRPDRYEITVRRIGFGPQATALSVGVGQNLTHEFRISSVATTLESVTIVAAPAGAETMTSEIATNVTRAQIEALPSADRNFMGLATLAPGVTLQNDRIDGTRKTFSAGAQGPEQVNVFIDGASYKNDILQGGVAGQDASRGNPFPRNAVQEFRVLTQNYKAEYQKASSAIITATTRSGGERWEGNIFANILPNQYNLGIGRRFDAIAADTFQRADRRTNANFRKPEFSRYQFGLSAGGPVAGRLKFFGAFEGSRQERASRVNIVPPAGFPALDTVNFAQYNGEFESPFRSSLFFGKLTFEHRDNSTFDLSYTNRHEKDVRDFGGLNAYTSATLMNNDVNTAVLKHNYFTGNWVSEATASFQRYHYNPVPNQPSTINRFFGFGCCVQIGGNISNQDFAQNRLSIREDVTYSGFEWAGQHVVKGGANVDFLKYDIVKRNSETPRFVYEPWFNNFGTPQRVEFQTGDPNFEDSNQQLGAYIQDDWSPTRRLLLNLGVRWDFESQMLNYDYVTPRAIVDSLTKYRDSLHIPLDTERYFTDGSDRDRFLGALQPRLGLSYALDEASRTTLFGGWGLYYDRNLYDLAIEESFALQHPGYRILFEPPGGDTDPNTIPFETRYLTEGKAALDELVASQRANTPEVKLIPNDLRPPMSQQFTAGVRHAIGQFMLEAAYTGVRSRNTPTFYFANMNFTCTPRTFACFSERRIPGFSTILMLDDNGKTWYDALAVKADRPYRRTGAVGWGAGLAYTLAERETEGFNDLFSFPNPADYPRQKRNDETHRIVSNFVTDVPYLWGAQFSGLITLGSGARYDLGDRFAPTGLQAGAGEPERHSFIIPNAFAYRMVDLRLRKDFVRVGGSRAGLTADLFNAFNYQNLGCYANQPDATKDDFGVARCVISDPRRLQLGLEYAF